MRKYLICLEPDNCKSNNFWIFGKNYVDYRNFDKDLQKDAVIDYMSQYAWKNRKTAERFLADPIRMSFISNVTSVYKQKKFSIIEVEV